VTRIARRAGAGGSVATVERPPTRTFALSRGRHPGDWRTDRDDLSVIRPFSQGTLEGAVKVPAAGRYGAWLGGTFKSGLRLEIDGKRVAEKRHRLNQPGNFEPMGEVELTPGTHRLSIHYDGADLHPGSGGQPYRMGPLVLGTTTAADRPVVRIPASRARTLCGKRLDWIEAIGPATRGPETAGELDPLTRSSQALFERQLRRREKK
jgi:hypothetical protein